VRSLRLHRVGELRLHEEPEPEPQPGEVLTRVRGVGLCGSDRHWFLEGGIGDAVLRKPLVLGHEFAGVVEEGPRAGERVVLDPAVPCGACPLCHAGQAHLCADVRFAGHGSTDGALRTLVAWPDKLVHALPDAVADEAAPLLEPLGVALLGQGRRRVGHRLGRVQDVLFDHGELIGVVIRPEGFFTRDVVLPREFIDRADDMALFARLDESDIENLKPFIDGG